MDYTLTTNMIDLAEMNGKSETEIIGARLNTLILSAEGTLPGNRNFGMQRSFLSRPYQQAKNLFAIELSEKAAQYIPEVKIKAVSGDVVSEGAEDITITVERSGK